MAYYMGDYYRGDFWSKLGKGLKKAAKFVAPIAAVALPFAGAGTLVGKGVMAARAVKRAGRNARRVRSLAQGAFQTALASARGGIGPAAAHRMAPAMPTLLTSPAQMPNPLTVTQPVGTPTLAVTPATQRIRRARQARAAYRRRTTAKRRTTTRTRRRTRARRSR